MSFRDSLSEFFKAKHDEIADDLTKQFCLPFEVSNASLYYDLTNENTGEEFRLRVCLEKK